jgi:multidrug efflux pump subunit AcrB
VVAARYAVVPLYLAACVGLIALLATQLGLEIFPTLDANEFRLRMRAPDGTHIERTEQMALEALRAVEELAGRDQVALSLGYVGTIPASFPINAVYQWSRGPEEAILRIALRRGGPEVQELKERLRNELARRLPEARFSFEPADIISEVMSFGAATPLEIAVRGGSMEENRTYAATVRRELEQLATLRDIQISQSLDYPTVQVRIDRERAAASDVTAAQIARSVVAATSSSRFVAPNYWPDPKTGIGYQVQIEIPQPRMASLDELGRLPVRSIDGQPLLLRDVADVTSGAMPGQFDRYNMKRELTLTANLADTMPDSDLGSVSRAVEAVLRRIDRQAAAERQAKLDRGEKPGLVVAELRGQIPPLRQLAGGLGAGLALAILAIFLLLTASFQSWRLALAAVSTAPAVLAGTLVALWVCGSTINVQSFIGAIMAIGVAMANAILLVSFAEAARKQSGDAARSAARGAAGRLRAILMTSAAMTAGMVPMALAWGESGAQTAPLGQAVIGGLAAATAATLLVLPAVFAVLQHHASRASNSLDPADSDSIHFRPAPMVAPFE